MDDSVREDISRLVGRYLSRRRSVWGDVVFILGQTKEDVKELRVEAGEGEGDIEAGGAELKTMVTHGGTGEEIVGGERGRREVFDGERKVSGETEQVSEGVAQGKHFSPADVIGERWKGESIRYRTEERTVEQGSLFSDSRVEAKVDLSNMDFDSLEKAVSTCEKCPLSRTRTNTVFGSGSRNARLLFIGEAPGREEDLQGLPFVGRAGQLLTKILASVGLSRDEVYITNILKCRPPNNRDPNEEEVKACEPFLKRQIELLKPVLICALGRVAGQTLLKRNASLSFLRGGIHYYNDIKVVVTYHPAALLRNPNLKKDAWEDIKMIRKLYDEELAELDGEG